MLCYKSIPNYNLSHNQCSFFAEIPHFKEVVIMATNCDSCGHKTNEVKSGSGIEDKGVRITFKINDENDYNKDVIKVCLYFKFKQKINNFLI